MKEKSKSASCGKHPDIDFVQGWRDREEECRRGVQG